MKPTGGSVDAFVAAVTPERRRRDAQTLIELLREVSGQEPALWGTIIGFGSCHYRYPTGYEGDSPVLGFAPRKTATTLYLLDGVDAYRPELERLGPHKTGTGCLYLSDVEKADLAVLRDILTRSHAWVESGGSDRMVLTLAR